VIASGDIHAVLRNHEVIESYLGETQAGDAPAGLEVGSA
jgi:hypothetical protein